jgi:tRNA A-37 threonylcarbamoyl transferase component Bud32
MTGALIARGRAADVLDEGPGRVRRRYRPGEGGDVEQEAAVMEYARRHGFPVPAVHEVSGRDLVLERVDGPTMLAALAAKPWLVGRFGRVLAGLHERLHAIPAPPEAPVRFGTGDRLVHFDLHPDNVLMAASGPVVIDWSNASRGDPADDVALTWAILATSVVPGPLPFRVIARAGRRVLLDAFLSNVDREAARARLGAVAARRLETDPHLMAPERRALAKLVR